MKKTLMCATAAAAFASVGLVAHAEDGWYARADIQASFDGTMDQDANFAHTAGGLTGDAAVDEQLGLNLGLGYGFDNGFRLEGVTGYRGGDLEPDLGVSSEIAGTFPAASGNIQVIDLMVNGLYDFNREGTFQPYVGLGVGGARVNAKGNNRVTTNGTDLSSANGYADSDTGLAYQG
ncbi:MAG: outer membrane protein, partial [Hyphomonas sp.]